MFCGISAPTHYWEHYGEQLLSHFLNFLLSLLVKIGKSVTRRHGNRRLYCKRDKTQHFHVTGDIIISALSSSIIPKDLTRQLPDFTGNVLARWRYLRSMKCGFFLMIGWITNPTSHRSTKWNIAKRISTMYYAPALTPDSRNYLKEHTITT